MPNTELSGFASLGADTFAAGSSSGNDNGQIDAVNRILPISANGRVGPFDGQPVQGFSGVQFAPGGDGSTYWMLSDNGFGAQPNSQDYLLRIYQVKPNFTGAENGNGSVEVQGFIQFSDPNQLIPFEIVNQTTSDRLLTGGDFDIESFAIDSNGDIWVGDEFGPYLLHFNAEGELVEAPIATPSLVQLNTLNGQPPLVIGHRGASGDFPEHTLEAYRAAIAGGADFIEPDLVITKDGVLIARHEPILDNTTNVAEVFGSERRSTKNLDGDIVTAYFAEDFTWAEIQQLRAVQSRDFRDPSFDGLFKIPSLQQIIELVQQVEAETSLKIGIYPETKHPTFSDGQTGVDGSSLSLEAPLVQVLLDNDFTDADRIFIQSFEIANLLELKILLTEAGIGDIPLVQLFGDTEGSFVNEGGGGFSVPFDLVANQNLSDAEKTAIYGELSNFINFAQPSYGNLANQAALQLISDYAAGIGPWKNNILLRESLDTPVDGNGDGLAEISTQLTGEVFPLIELAHNAGLQVHPYTLRNEERFLTLNPDGTPQSASEEFQQLIQLGVDGFFTDFPRTGDAVRDRLVASTIRSPQNPEFKFNSLNGQTPIVVGHRGASGQFPEHTLEAYRLAIFQDADFIEPDLAITKDGVLIARHEPILNDTTNVAEVFGSERMSTKVLDGETITAYFAEDFTLAEIKQLRAVQSRDFRNDSFDGLFEIPTLQEIIELVQSVEAQSGLKVGIYPETKHPTFFDNQTGMDVAGNSISLSLEEPLIETLVATGFTDPNRIFIQSFELANLIELRQTLLPEAGLERLKLVQLFGDTNGSFINEGGGGFSVPFDFVANANLSETELREVYGDLVDLIDFSASPTYENLANAEIIRALSSYADGLGPWKNNILLRESLDTSVDGDGDGVAEITTQLTGEIFPLIEFAHDAGLQVHPYTLRDEERFLTLNADGTIQSTGDEFRQLIELGVDGFFTDFPETGRIVVQTFPDLGDANLRQSRGYEGMAISPDQQTLYPLLEGTVVGDPAGSLRIYSFDIASVQFTDLVGLYQLEVPNHAIGDFTVINENEFLIIERDGRQGDAAQFKKIFKIDITELDENGFVLKQEIADLLNIADPNDLNNDGETTFEFPFVTIEDVLVLDEKHILVANDNNYPFSVGRGPDIDNNEIIQLELEDPLAVDPRVGIEALSRSIVQGTTTSETLVGNDIDDFVFGSDGNDTLAGGLGNDEIFGEGGDDVIRGDVNSRNAQGNRSGGDDILHGGAGNDRIGGKSGDDQLFGDEGDDQLWGDDGMIFWLVVWVMIP